MLPSVFSVTSDQLMGWLVAFLWPFVRMLGLIGASPIFGEIWVPRPYKVIIAALLTFIISPTLPAMPAVPPISFAGLWILAQQLLIGVAMAFVIRLVFAGVVAAGDYIGLQMGLSFASFFDPMSQGATMVVSRLLNMLAVLLFLAVDGHLMMLDTLAQSFQILPIANGPLASQGWMFLASLGAQVFTLGMMLSLPLVTALLTLNLAMGILNRASPQFSIFAVGFPLTLLAGIGMMGLLMPQLGPFLGPHFHEALVSMQRLLRVF